MAQKPIGYYGEFRPTGVDQSAARRFEALAGIADQVNEIAFKVAAKKRAEQGQEAGLAAGIEAAEAGKPVEKNKGILSGISIYDQAYNSALEKSYVASIDTDARENIARIAEESNGDSEKFDQLSNQYLNGLRGGISEDYRDIVQLSIDPVVASARSQVQSQQITRQRQETDERLVNNINSAIDSGIRLASLGDTEAAMASLQSSTESIKARVESGAISQAAADNIIKESSVTVESAIGRGALKNTYETLGPIAALEYSIKIRDTPLKGFTVEQQENLVSVLGQDLTQFMRLDSIKETESENALIARQDQNALALLIGINSGKYTNENGEVVDLDSGTLALSASSQDISFEQYKQLTTTLNSRGQGIDDFNVIANIQSLILSDPDQATNLIRQNMNTLITGETAVALLKAARDAGLDESLLKTNKAIRAQKYLENSIVTTGIYGTIYPERQLELAQLTLTLQERILNGEDPLVVAREILEFSDITSDSVPELEAEYKNIEESLKAQFEADITYDATSEEERLDKIRRQIQEKKNYLDFNKNVMSKVQGGDL